MLTNKTRKKNIASHASSGSRLHSKRDKPAAAKCALCSAKLAGMPRLHSTQLKRLSKTEKRPERAFGGIICGKCVKRILTEKTRLENGSMTKHNVDFRHLKYIEAMKKI
ncbi:hypothetical protein AUJ14_06070 [Candidatus Micrarchaeota archaeon CG1_02_55_22]|nr:MAG: hypothetical protein AUJ14_06070 [Candidatus Micrarchaeota archaeon CG1_02_55_22]